MANYEQERAELLQRHEQALADLEKKRDILQALPNGLLGFDWHVYVHKLWDRQVSLSVEPCRYESIKKHLDPTLDTIRQIWNAFPALPLAIYRDGCVSIRTLGNANEEHARAQARMTEGNETSATVTPIAPFYVRVDPSDHDIEFHWIAVIGSKTVEIKVKQSWVTLNKFASLDIRYGNVNDHGQRIQAKRVTANNLNIHQAFTVIGDARAEKIRYASGSPERPGEHVVYWNSCNGEPAQAALPMLLDKLV